MGAVLRLGVLDQSPVRSGGTATDSVLETLELAQAADRLGYHRYWLAEHHATPGLAGSCPEILIGQVAARTSRIRVGSGGVMLSHYSALKVAESFRMLELLFPGRIDLGIGRAPGSDGRTARVLRHVPEPSGAEFFPDQLAELIGFLGEAGAPADAAHGVRAMPEVPGTPALWLLGSSDQSAMLAAHFGAAFSFAHFINGEGGAEITRAYTDTFRASATLSAPQASAAVFVVCADTEAEAWRLARSRELFILRLHSGRPGRYPSVEEAEAYPYTAHERAVVEYNRRRTVAGTPEQVHARLTALAAEYGVDELIIVTITHDPKARLRSYELLAQAFELT
jgi:luciferase family oxidoreductase group 1